MTEPGTRFGGVAVPQPPASPVETVVDVVHGTPVPDPYRWLEDGTATRTRTWADEHNRRTRAVLDAVPTRADHLSRLQALYRAGTAAAPGLAGGRVFSLDRWGDHDQAVLVVRALHGEAPGEPSVLVDPVAVGGDATTAIDWYQPSRDGRLLAFGLSSGGDERSTLRVLDVASGQRLPDEIPHCRAASVGWLPDASGFYYTRYEGGGDYNRLVFAHQLGQPWQDDTLVFGDLPDPTAWPSVACSRDGRWLLIHLTLGWSRTDVHLLERATLDRRTLIEGIEAINGFTVDVRGGRLIGSTTLDADRGRIVTAPLDDPAHTRWRTLVPESAVVLETWALTAEHLLVATSESAVSRLWRHDPDDGRLLDEVPLPEPGSLAGLATDRDEAASVFSFTSFTRPPGLFRLASGAGVAPEPWSDLPGAPDPAAFSVEQVTYPSLDGTEIPMFLIRSATSAGAPAGPAPTVLNGYGGFMVIMSPAWSPLAVAHCERGGLFAVACLRGGAELGEAWHQAGMRQNKQNVFDDFAAAGDWLVAEGLTTRQQLAVRGGSNGGLLVGATITQRPDLAAAAICAVPLLDMVRFPEFLIAKLWTPEYGDPLVAEEFAWLWEYSPYHRVVDGTCYPATLLLTGEEDSRVDPAHARKMAARLEAATSCGDRRPILVRIEAKAGHGQGKPSGQQAEEGADVLAFLDLALA